MSSHYSFSVSDADEGQRLDQFLTQHAELDLSRSRIQALIKEGRIKVNNQETKPKYPIKSGEDISVLIPDPVPLYLQAEEIPLDVVYEDEDLLVINKPVGLVVHPGAGNPEHTMVNALLAHCKNLSGIGGVQRPGIIHRLDKDTSGLLVVAKNDFVHKGLSEQLAQRDISRQYFAIVGGTFTRSGGTIDLPMGRHATNRQKMAVDEYQGRSAVTHYQVQERFNNSTLVLVKLDTGRTHQIRVHMAHIKHPVLGDKVYGRWTKISLKGDDRSRHEITIARQMLHAAKLTFMHPVTGREIHCEAPLPEDIQELLTALRVDSC